MAGYELGNNTLSFLKFDQNPTSSTVYDSIANSPIRWIKNNVYPLSPTLKIYKSRAYSICSTTTLPTDTSYLMTEISYDNNYGLFDSKPPFQSTISHGNVTLDFWFYPFKKTTELYKSRAVLAFYGLMSPNNSFYVFNNGNPSAYYQINLAIILSSYETNSETKIGVYIQTDANIWKYNATGQSSNYPTYRYFRKLGVIDANKWSHLALMKEGPAFSLALNGKIYSENSYKEFGFTGGYDPFYHKLDQFVNSTAGAIIVLGSYLPNNNTIYSGVIAHTSTNGEGYNYYSNDARTAIDIGKETQTSSIAFDNVRLSNDILWANDFTPPGNIGKQIFIYDDYAYYVNDKNTVSKLSFTKWNDISISDKLTLLDMVEYNDLPSVSQIKQIQTDPSKDIICLNYQTDTVKPSIKIEKIDESSSQIIYPTKFMDYGSMEGYLYNIYASYSLSAAAIIRLAVTKDGETYYGYNFTNNEWVPLDHKSDIVTDGILVDNLKDIPRIAWIQFGLSKFAFGIALVKTRDDDTCSLNDITLKVSLTEKWIKANKTTQTKIKYIGPTMMKVTFLEDGKYKINYNDRR